MVEMGAFAHTSRVQVDVNDSDQGVLLAGGPRCQSHAIRHRQHCPWLTATRICPLL